MQVNTQTALSVVALIEPAAFEEKQEERKKLVSRLDSLDRSYLFFHKEYKEANRAVHLMNILAEVGELRSKIAVIPKTYTIGELNQKDNGQLTDCLALIINDLRLFFAVDNMISTDGIFSLCNMIIAKFKFLTLEEVAVCMNKAKMGEYGTVYNRIDGMIILSWMKQYVDERQARINERNYSADVHAKIGIGEGRSAAKSNIDLLDEAYVMIYKKSKKQ